MDKSQNLSVKLWPAHERPRERILRGPAAHLSNAELLAILLGSGLRGKDAVSLAREIFSRFQGWRGLMAAEPEVLRGISGLGPAKTAALLAVGEIFKRSLGEALPERDLFREPEAVHDYLRASMRDQKREVFKVLFLDKANRLLKDLDLFKGTIDQAGVYPREIVQEALLARAAAVILVHNHPSGNLSPSREDRELTQKIIQACCLVGVKVLDHVIVGGQGHFSFAAQGLL